MTTGTPPVFFDPKRRRWKNFIFLSVIVFSILALIIGGLAISIIEYEILPAPNLPSGSSIQQPPTLPLVSLNPNTNSYEIARYKLLTYLYNHIPPDRTPVKQQEVIGYYVNWDNASFISLEQNISSLTVLIPEWAHLQPDGSFLLDDPSQQAQVIAYIKTNQPELKIVPLINNYNSKIQDFDGNLLHQALSDPQKRAALIQNLMKYVQSNQFAGIHIDFEKIDKKYMGEIEVFMKELYTQFHAANLEVSQSVPLSDPAVPYIKLASYNDYLVLLAYNEHDPSSAAGPVSSQDWYIQGLGSRLEKIPADKFVIAFGAYGYDWGDPKVGTQNVNYDQIITLAKSSTTGVTWDPATLNPHFDYVDASKNNHQVWFLDAATLYNQIIVTQRFRPHGYALWRLGSEEPDVWNVFGNLSRLNSATAKSLENIQSGYGINYVGEGEIIKVISIPQAGKRTITVDNQTGMIVNEQYKTFVDALSVEKFGYAAKKVALTFDDGPSAEYTPQILDIMQKENVNAAFFIVGDQADANLGVLNRIYQSGHEIGVHTFTHPNLNLIPTEELVLELNATQRLIESTTGHSTILFRPPYGEDVDPSTPQQITVLNNVSKMGYYTVGMNIDPSDWARPGVNVIISSVISQTETNQGGIILLHDAGGDRSQTVAALPQIISQLKARGYEFVTLSQLMALPENVVMPSVLPQDQLDVYFSDVGFLITSIVVNLFGYIFLAGIILGVARQVIIIFLAVIEKVKRSRKTFDPKPVKYPGLTVIIPAYNEEKVIVKTVANILKSDYPNFDVIVVDDGSSDNTYQAIIKAYGDHPQVSICTKENGGKSNALNYGIQRTRADIVVIQDADTIFDTQALSKLARWFTNPNVGAVAGNAKVGNRINLLTRFQTLEYITSQNLDRRAFDLLNCITVVPGAIGAWRRDLILQAGGFISDTLAEDAEMTFRILMLGKEIVYDEQAIAYTEAPENVKNFLKQRFRWMFGTFQTVWKHSDAAFRPQYGFLGFFAIPNIFVFQIVFPTLMPLLDLYAFLNTIFSLTQKYQHPDYSMDGLIKVLVYYIVFLLFDFIVAVFAFSMEKKENFWLILLLPIQRFIYRQLYYYLAIKTTLTAIQGPRVGWGKFSRTATVSEPK